MYYSRNLARTPKAVNEQLRQTEKTNEKLLDNVREQEETNGVLTDQLNELKNNCEDVRAVASENEELLEKCNVLDAKLKRFENLAEEVSEVYTANKSLEEENKRIKLENERIVSQMEQLKQATIRTHHRFVQVTGSLVDSAQMVGEHGWFVATPPLHEALGAPVEKRPPMHV